MARLIRIRNVCLLATFGVFVGNVARPAAAQYAFTQRVSAGAQFTALDTDSMGYAQVPPSLDNDGSIAFLAGTPEVYDGSGFNAPGKGYFIALPNGNIATETAFYRLWSAVRFPPGPLSYHGGQVTYAYGALNYLLDAPGKRYAAGNGQTGLIYIGPPSTSPDGIAVFLADIKNVRGVRWSAGMPTQSYDWNALPATIAADPNVTYSNPRINRRHQVAFTQSASSGAALIRGDIYGGPLTPLADTTKTFQSFSVGANQLTLSDNGDVTFVATPKSGGTGIFRANTGGVTTLVPATAVFAAFLRHFR